jgi:hypothetical protein
MAQVPPSLNDNGSERPALEIHVLSFNINLLPVGNNPIGHQYKDQRLQAFLEHIDKYHIIALQEAFSTPFLWGCRKRLLIHEARQRGFHYIVDCPQPGYRDLLTKRVRYLIACAA